MNLILLFFPLVFLPCVLPDGDFKCWSTDHSKVDSMKSEKFNEGDNKADTCDSKKCFKTEVKVQGAKQYTRGCVTSVMFNDVEGCVTLDPPKPNIAVKGTRVCVCKKSKCNDASSLIPPYFTGVAIFLALIVWKLATRSF